LRHFSNCLSPDEDEDEVDASEDMAKF